MASKESLEKKLEDLNRQFTQLQANANAVQGAIQVIEQLIAEETIPEAADKKD